MVSTPLGATAYGLSAGGPVIRPDATCLLLVPLCARELLLRPVILPLTAQVIKSIVVDTKGVEYTVNKIGG